MIHRFFSVILLAMAPFVTNAGQTKDKLVEATEASIRKDNPNVSKDLIANDLRVIQSTLPKAETKLKARGLPGDEATQLVTTAWRGLRNPSQPLAKLTAKKLGAKIGSLGRLEIKSKPSQADIIADGQRIDQTDAAYWFEPGDHKIKLTKVGYVDDDDVVHVVEGQNEPYVKKLHLKP
jgi:PEGA domain